MSVRETDIIDAMAESDNKLVMQVFDQVTWEIAQVEHLKLLQNKLNNYIRYIDHKGWKDKFGDVEYDRYEIEIIFSYSYPPAFEKMIELVKDKLDAKNISIIYRVYDEG